jgi:hypothetical protein
MRSGARVDLIIAMIDETLEEYERTQSNGHSDAVPLDGEATRPAVQQAA